MNEPSSEILTGSIQRRQKGSGLKVLSVLLVILALVGVIIYLLSLLNSKKFFLAPEGDRLVVKKGVFFLVGSEPFQGQSPEEATIYGPIDLPANFGTAPKEYGDLASLNREFANLLIEQTQALVFSQEEETYRRGKTYQKRLQLLQGLDMSQIKKIQELGADIDYFEARRAYLRVERTLERALKKFKLAESSESGRFTDAKEWCRRVETLLEVIRNTKSDVPTIATTPPPVPLGAADPQLSNEVPPVQLVQPIQPIQPIQPVQPAQPGPQPAPAVRAPAAAPAAHSAAVQPAPAVRQPAPAQAPRPSAAQPVPSARQPAPAQAPRPPAVEHAPPVRSPAPSAPPAEPDAASDRSDSEP